MSATRSGDRLKMNRWANNHSEFEQDPRIERGPLAVKARERERSASTRISAFKRGGFGETYHNVRRTEGQNTGIEVVGEMIEQEER